MERETKLNLKSCQSKQFHSLTNTTFWENLFLLCNYKKIRKTDNSGFLILSSKKTMSFLLLRIHMTFIYDIIFA